MGTIINAGRIAPIPKGLYNNSTQYVGLDVVTYNYESYICKQPCQGIAPSDSDYWQLLAGQAGGGKSIVSITKTSTAGLVDTYTILYTDASTTTFEVTNGKDGTDGADGRGIESITKTGTSGLVDTYTITYSDATTSTFNVTNGAQGEQGEPGEDGYGYSNVAAPTPADGTAIITLTNGDTITIDLNHVHPQYPRYELVNALPQDPDSGTLYLIAAT